MFKNGRVYEGMFEHDHIVEYPDFNIDGSTTPDISNIRTRTPVPSGMNGNFKLLSGVNGNSHIIRYE